MKRTHFTRAMILVTVLTALAAPAFGEGASELESSSGPAVEGFPLTVVDDSGAELTLQAPPQRIVSLTVFTDDVLVDLVDHDRIVAVTTFAEDSAVSNVSDKVADIESKITLNVEVVLSLDPDIVFVANWSDTDNVSQLRNAGIDVYLLATPLTVSDIAAKIASIAEIVGAPEAGDQIVGEMMATIEDVQSRTANIPDSERKTVLDYAVWGTATGVGTSWQEIIDHAGVINAAADLAVNDWEQVPLSKEVLVELDPDILILPGWVYGEPTGATDFYKQVTDDPALKNMQAIQDGTAIQMPERLKSATSQYIADAIRFLAEQAYPDRF